MDPRINSLLENATNGYIKCIKMLIRSGVDINCIDLNTGCTALHNASKNGHVDIVEYLLNNGADKEILNFDGKKAGDICINPKVCQLLIEGYQDIPPNYDTLSINLLNPGSSIDAAGDELLIQVNVSRNVTSNVIGAVFLAPYDTIGKIKELVNEQVAEIEFEDLFRIYKTSPNKERIPISNKQEHLKLNEVLNFKNGDELVVIL